MNSDPLEMIAKFVEYGDCVVIKQKDWDNLAQWTDTVNNKDRPKFDLMGLSFSLTDED